MASSPYPHYAWAAGHFILLLSTIRYFLALLTFKSGDFTIWYRLGFLGVLTSYSIVVYKSIGVPNISQVKAWLNKALVDENFQYWSLAAYWTFTKPVALALLPFATFSFFHVATFTRTTIIPKVFPTQPTPGQAQPSSHPYSKKIHAWVKANYDPAMILVAWTELAIFVRILLGVVLLFTRWRVSILTLLIYGQFLRVRYFHSNFTRTVFAKADAELTARLNQQGIPPAVPATWAKVRSLIIGWGQSGVVQAQPQPAAGAASS